MRRILTSIRFSRVWRPIAGTSGIPIATRRSPGLATTRLRRVRAPRIRTIPHGAILTRMAPGMTFRDTEWAGRRRASDRTGILTAQERGGITTVSAIPGSRLIHGAGGRITAEVGTGLEAPGGCGSRAVADGPESVLGGIRTGESGTFLQDIVARGVPFLSTVPRIYLVHMSA